MRRGVERLAGRVILMRSLRLHGECVVLIDTDSGLPRPRLVPDAGTRPGQPARRNGNNSGKTSILECIELLRSADDPTRTVGHCGAAGRVGLHWMTGIPALLSGLRPDSPRRVAPVPESRAGRARYASRGFMSKTRPPPHGTTRVTVCVTEPSLIPNAMNGTPELDDDYADAYLDLRIRVVASRKANICRAQGPRHRRGCCCSDLDRRCARETDREPSRSIHQNQRHEGDGGVARTYSKHQVYGDKDESIKTGAPHRRARLGGPFPRRPRPEALSGCAGRGGPEAPRNSWVKSP